MTSHEIARSVANYCLWKNHELLQRVVKGQLPLESYRYFLRSIQESLDEFCRNAKERGQAEDCPELFEPLSDALVMINFALANTPIDGEAVKAALESLDECAAELELAPA